MTGPQMLQVQTDADDLRVRVQEDAGLTAADDSDQCSRHGSK